MFRCTIMFISTTGTMIRGVTIGMVPYQLNSQYPPTFLCHQTTYMYQIVHQHDKAMYYMHWMS